MARYSKTALYKLQNEIHAVKPGTLTNFERKIVQIPEAHVAVNPLNENKSSAMESDLKDPFAPIDSSMESLQKKPSVKTIRKSSTKKTSGKKAAAKKQTKKLSAKKTVNKIANKKSKPIAKHSKKAAEKGEKNMREMKKESLKSSSGKKVKSRKQAHASGLSKALKIGVKPSKAPAKTSKHSTSKAMAKKAVPKKSVSKKTTSKKSTAKKVSNK